jgi:hypothetical protein
MESQYEGSVWQQAVSLFQVCDIVTLLTAYLDESGTHDGSHSIVVGGVIASQSEWDAILHRWIDALNRRGVKYFHAADFSNRQGEFKGWTESECRSLMADLLLVFEDFVILPVGIGVSRDRFSRIRAEKYSEIPDDPYGFCVAETIQRIIYIGNEIKPEPAIAVVLEERQKQKSLLPIRNLDFELQYPEVRKHYKLASLAIADKKIHRQLELADFVAYELFKANLAPSFESGDLRYPFRRLMEIAEGRIAYLATLSDEGVRRGMEKFSDLCILCK